MKLSNKNGFTLIELLVVISIIALLMSVLMPALNKVRKQGKLVVCTSNMKQLGLAIYGYSTESDGDILASQTTGAGELSKAGPLWYQTLRNNRYIDFDNKEAKVLHCPEDRRSMEFCSYAANRYTMGLANVSGYDLANQTRLKVRKLNTIKDTANTILLGESSLKLTGDSNKIGGAWSAWGASVWAFSSTEKSDPAGCGLDWRVHAPKVKIVELRLENGCSPIAFVDGHCDVVKISFDCDSREGLRWGSPDGAPKLRPLKY